MKTKCKQCHREIEFDENIVMVQCRCGEVVYDKYTGGLQ